MIWNSASAEQAGLFSLQSSSFANQAPIPSLYTCDGKDFSPPLRWSGTPHNTQTFALICADPDAPGGVWYHWVLYNLPGTLSELTAHAVLPLGAAMGKNSWGHRQYNGPCPPVASTHHYNFTLYALDASLPLPEGADAKAVLQAMQGHVLGKAVIQGVFGR